MNAWPYQHAQLNPPAYAVSPFCESQPITLSLATRRGRMVATQTGSALLWTLLAAGLVPAVMTSPPWSAGPLVATTLALACVGALLHAGQLVCTAVAYAVVAKRAPKPTLTLTPAVPSAGESIRIDWHYPWQCDRPPTVMIAVRATDRITGQLLARRALADNDPTRLSGSQTWTLPQLSPADADRADWHLDVLDSNDNVNRPTQSFPLRVQ